ncbi:hypothetical protein DIPPA_32687 [Diplonema papillatum]|nr:hypothetical protein DIPPA_32687 [Diplonema papillatum]
MKGGRQRSPSNGDFLSPDPVRRPPLFLYGLGVAVVMLIGKVGDAVGPVLVTENPWLLLLLNANDLHCVLTASSISFVPWLLLCAARRMIEDPLFYMLGLHHGSAAVTFVKARFPVFEMAEAVIRRASTIAVALDPGMVVCLMSGVHQMPAQSFFCANFLGTILRLLLLRLIPGVFPAQVQYCLSMIHAYQKWCVFAVVVVLCCSSWRFLRLFEDAAEGTECRRQTDSPCKLPRCSISS